MRTWARREHIDMTGGRTAGTALDYPAEMSWDQCRHVLYVEIPETVEPVDGIAVSRRDAGLWAAIRVRGDLEAVAFGWAVLFRTWLPGSGYRQRDVRQEEAYHTLPEESGWANYDLTCYLPIEPDLS
jgi:AraC family transcriptional regulator